MRFVDLGGVMGISLLVAACGSTVPPWPGDGDDDGGGDGSITPAPVWGAPLSGGNLLVTADGQRAVIADPDRDRIVSVDLASREVIVDLPLEPGDEPGRVIEDGAGRVHVALRRGGAIVTLAGADGPITARRAACAEPRGIAYQAATDQLHVACAGGELVSFAAAGGDATRSLRLDRDLRDVVVVGDDLLITRMKSAEVLTVNAEGAITARVTPPSVERDVFTPTAPGPLRASSIPAVAWRAVALPDGSGIAMVHQRARRAPLMIEPGGYGGDMCGGGPLEPTVSKIVPGGAVEPGRAFFFAALPIDLAVSPDGQRVAVAMAGDQSVRVVRSTVYSGGEHPPCEMPPEEEQFVGGVGTPSSVAFTPEGQIVVWYPEQRTISVQPLLGAVGEAWQRSVGGDYGYDEGRALFHRITGAGIACASCHPEGREDGLVWEFDKIGLRRTQHVGGAILARAPYHWDADMTDLATLMSNVFSGRMAGGDLSPWQVKALGNWLDAIPAPKPPAPLDAAAVARGKIIFEEEAGCIACHSGPLFTNNQRVDVGTGGAFKVPSLLGIGARAPFLHTGCAPTLRARFDCGGGDAHGATSQLSEQQLGDLVAYLETL